LLSRLSARPGVGRRVDGRGEAARRGWVFGGGRADSRLGAGDLRLLALAALVGGIMVHFGERDLVGLVAVGLGMVLAFAACFAPRGRRPSPVAWAVAGVGCALAGLYDHVWAVTYWEPLVLAVASVTAAVVLPAGRMRRLAAASAVLAGIAAVVTSITFGGGDVDVYDIVQRGPALLMHGVNPYTHVLSATGFDFSYGPTVLLLASRRGCSVTAGGWTCSPSSRPECCSSAWPARGVGIQMNACDWQCCARSCRCRRRWSTTRSSTCTWCSASSSGCGCASGTPSGPPRASAPRWRPPSRRCSSRSSPRPYGCRERGARSASPR